MVIEAADALRLEPLFAKLLHRIASGSARLSELGDLYYGLERDMNHEKNSACGNSSTDYPVLCACICRG